MSTLVRWNPFQELDSFERRMRRMLDELADPDEIAAEFAKGVLTVRAPKTATAKPRKVEIAAKA